MGWCFAKINGRLAEIYFEETKGEPDILGHAYVDANKYKAKKEQRWIAADTAKFQLTYKNKEYKRINF